MAESKAVRGKSMKHERPELSGSGPKTGATALPKLAFSEASLSAAKWLALVLMIIDHTNKYLLNDSQHWMYVLGRISMPLFAFVLGYNLSRPGMLASGAYRRVAVRLAVFGLLATPAFMALNKLPAGWWPLNMMFTLLVPVVAVWLVAMGRPWATILACLVVAWGGVLGEYWWPAIGLCLAVWGYQRSPSKGLIVGFVLCLVLLFFVNGNHWALAAMPVLALLQRWKVMLPRVQWLFYVIYPAHLTLFWLYLNAKG